MARQHRREDFIRQASELLRDIRIAVAQMQAAAARITGGAPQTVATSRIDEALARLASLPRSGATTMMSMPIDQLRDACEALVKPGCVRRDVYDLLRSQGYPGRKTAFYQFANRFTAMYRQVQMQQLSPTTPERASNGL